MQRTQSNRQAAPRRLHHICYTDADMLDSCGMGSDRKSKFSLQNQKLREGLRLRPERVVRGCFSTALLSSSKSSSSSSAPHIISSP